jgi:hypothetical protein
MMRTGRPSATVGPSNADSQPETSTPFEQRLCRRNDPGGLGGVFAPREAWHVDHGAHRGVRGDRPADDLPPGAIDRARLCLLDTLGVAVRGADTTAAGIVRE